MGSLPPESKKKQLNVVARASNESSQYALQQSIVQAAGSPWSSLLQAEDLLKLGDEALSRDKLVQASRHYSEALRMDPENAAAYVRRAKVYFQQERYEYALTDIKKALEVDLNCLEVSGRKIWERMCFI